ncbi:MAG: thioredoxin family protein [Bacteroidales bacterium]|nr:thioredoxin family protein [Bacteroidales bacterium]
MTTLTSAEDLRLIIEKETGTLVYFYNDNCAPCLSLRPKVEKMLNENFSKMKLVFVNGLSKPEIPAAFGVYSNPTIIIFFEGKEFRRESIYISVSQLEKEIQRPYSLLFE